MRTRRFVAPLAALAVVAAFGMWLHGAVPDVPTGTWLPGPALAQPRMGATSVTLSDGSVLVIGGRAADGPVRTVDVYGADGVLRTGRPLGIPRAGHAAAALPDGSVLVVGGTTTALAEDGSTREVPTGSAELYVGGAWMAVGSLSAARTGHTATALPDGRVLVAGGSGEAGAAIDSLEVYDPAQGTFSFLTVLPAGVTEHAAALAGETRVLIAGGRSGGAVLDSASLVDVDTASVVPVMLGGPRAAASATTLLNGKILIAGGYTVEQTEDGRSLEHDLATSEVVNVKVSPAVVSAGPSMAQPRRAPQTLLLPNNNTVLVTGGTTAGAVVEGAEQFVPWANAFVTTGSPSAARAAASLAGVTDGVALLAGGTAAPTELYGFATIRTDKDDYSPGMTVYVSGSGWQPGEAVTFKLREVAASDGTTSTSCTLRTFTLEADAAGRITNAKLFDVEEHHLGVRFYLTAVGVASQAQITFTDGAVKVRSNASGVTFSLTWTSFSNADCTGSVTGSGSGSIGFVGGTIGAGSPPGIKLTASASATTPVNATFTSWASDDPFTVAGVQTICVSGQFSGQREYVATYTANAPPTSGPQSITTLEDTARLITLSSSDDNGDAQTFSIVTGPAHGTLSGFGAVTCSGTSPKTCAADVTYTPAANYNGPDSFSFKSNDGSADSAVATVSITVTPVNDAPVFTKGANQTVLEDAGAQAVLGWATGIGAGGGTDEAGQTVTFAVTNNTNASLFTVAPAIAANGTLTYTPAANQAGTATITIALSDNGGTADGGADTSATQAFDITVTPVNDAPVFSKGADQAVLEDVGAQTVANWATGIGAGGGADEAGQTLTFVVTGNDNPGLFDVAPAVAANGTLTYTPAADRNGTATITLKLTDSGGTANGGIDSSPTQTFTITVTPVNDAPVFTKGADQTVPEDAGAQTVPNWATGISPGGGPDEATQTLAFHITGNTNPGLFALGPEVSSVGTLTFTPAPNQSGTATITVSLSDDGGTANGGVESSSPTTFDITISPVNDAPIFTKGADQTVGEDSGGQTVSNWATGIGAGGGPDEAGQILTFSVTGNTNPDLFAVAPSLSADGTLTYTPATNRNGAATITLELKDDGGTANGGVDTSAAQTFTITVTPDNDAPVASDGSASLDEDTTVAIDLAALVSDIETSDGNLTYTVTSNPSKGTLSGSGASLVYTPAPNVNGTDSFTYQVTDRGDPDGCAGPAPSCSAALSSAVKTVTITIVPVNDVPVINIVTATPAAIDEGGSVLVSGSFTDPDEDDSHGVLVTWQDGSTDTLTLASGVLTFQASHQYKDDNPTATSSDVYPISIAVTDAEASATATTPVTVSNVAPAITSLTGPAAPLSLGNAVTIRANFTDAGTDTHTCAFEWDDGSSNAGVIASETEGNGYCEATHVFASPGVYGVKVTVTDDDTGTVSSTYEFAVIYDPSAGFVTGGGWFNSPAGACRLASCTDATIGRANFGFVSKYKKGSNVPEGQTEFQFQAGKLNFHSSSYDAGSLVVSGYKAQYRGTGDVNGVPGHKFVLTAYDGQVNGGGGTDRFRIKITYGGAVVYDNKMGASDDIDTADPMAIAGGSIVIHK